MGCREVAFTEFRVIAETAMPLACLDEKVRRLCILRRDKIHITVNIIMFMTP